MESKVFRNEFLISQISSFLPLKDKVAFSSASKHIKNVANPQYKEMALKYYTSDQMDYSYFCSAKTDNYSIQYFGNPVDNFSFSPLETDWETFLLNGKKLEKLFSKINPGDENFPLFNNQSTLIGEELFKKLKEFFTLPNLRKINKFVENENNTNHQTFLYDFLYDDQDIYLYYKKQNKNKNKNNLVRKDSTDPHININCRSPRLPFAECFPNMEFLSNTMDTPENLFEEIRCYSLTFGKERIVNFDYEGMVNFHKNFNLNFGVFFHSFLFGDLSVSNCLIKLLVLIYISIIFYCLVTFTVINDEKEQKEFLLLDNISKRVSVTFLIFLA